MSAYGVGGVVVSQDNNGTDINAKIVVYFVSSASNADRGSVMSEFGVDD